MNAGWFPWGVGTNGNTTTDYVTAWRHIHDIFEQEGATNVRWVWAPNVKPGLPTPYAELYPGDDYVDWRLTVTTGVRSENGRLGKPSRGCSRLPTTKSSASQTNP